MNFSQLQYGMVDEELIWIKGENKKSLLTKIFLFDYQNCKIVGENDSDEMIYDDLFFDTQISQAYVFFHVETNFTGYIHSLGHFANETKSSK